VQRFGLWHLGVLEKFNVVGGSDRLIQATHCWIAIVLISYLLLVIEALPWFRRGGAPPGLWFQNEIDSAIHVSTVVKIHFTQ
jgi:hypothetical protein